MTEKTRRLAGRTYEAAEAIAVSRKAVDWTVQMQRMAYRFGTYYQVLFMIEFDGQWHRASIWFMEEGEPDIQGFLDEVAGLCDRAQSAEIQDIPA